MNYGLKKNAAIFLIFTLLFFFVNHGEPVRKGGEDAGKKLLVEGETLYRDFKFLDALEKFKKAELILKSTRYKVRLYLNMSKVYFQLGVLNKTEELLKKVLQLKPGAVLEKNLYPPSYGEIFDRLKQESSIIEKVGKKKKGKKKKFPVLLAALGLAAAGLIIYFLVKKSKKKKQYMLTVTRGEGVEGGPESGQYSYREGEPVNYSYQLEGGYGNLQVTLDGAGVPASGTITMDRNHTLAALADQQLAFIHIESDPTGAVVSLNGQPRASNTPCSFYITEGNYEFWLYNPLFGGAKKTITIEEGNRYDIKVTLSPYRHQFSTSWGGEGGEPGRFRNVPDLAIDHNGYIYVTDWGNNRVQKFDSNGGLILTWKGNENGGQMLDRPHGITVDGSNNVYVVEYGNHRVRKFDSNGNSITQWGKKGSKEGLFKNPYGICADQGGYLYVTDWWNNRVQKFDSNGTYILAWGQTGSGTGEFKNPFCISAGNDNNIYVSDFKNYRIQEFDANGIFITAWNTGAGQPRGIAVDGYGYIYVANGDHKIQKFDPTGNILTEWGSYGQGTGQFNLPTGLGIGADGSLYVADNRNNRIQKFSLSDQAVGTGVWSITTTTMGTVKRSGTKKKFRHEDAKTQRVIL